MATRTYVAQESIAFQTPWGPMQTTPGTTIVTEDGDLVSLSSPLGTVYVRATPEELDDTVMSLTDQSPAADATDVAVDEVISLTFDKDIEEDSVTDETFVVTADDVPWPGTYSVVGPTVEYTPDDPYPESSVVEVIIPSEPSVAFITKLNDTEGMGDGNEVTFSFTIVPPPGPVILFSDDFNRADESPAGASPYVGHLAWFGMAGDAILQSNKLVGWSINGHDLGHEDDFPGDVSFEVTVAQLATPSIGAFLFLQIRVQGVGGTFNCYTLRIADASSRYVGAICKIVNGSVTPLGTTGVFLDTLGDEVAVGSKLRIEAVGTTINAYHTPVGESEVLVDTVVDATHASVPGQVGVSIQQNWHIDDFLITEP